MSFEDLDNSGAKKLLLDNLDRLEEENSGLKQFERKYYDASETVGILETTLKGENKRRISYEVIATGAFGVGFMLVGRSYMADSADGFGLTCGILLILLGLGAKAIQLWPSK